jgi:hypothetical protein
MYSRPTGSHRVAASAGRLDFNDTAIARKISRRGNGVWHLVYAIGAGVSERQSRFNVVSVSLRLKSCQQQIPKPLCLGAFVFNLFA